MSDRYKHLDPAKVVETVEQLHRRIVERFPDASLASLVQELTASAREAIERSAWIRRPLIGLRLLTAAVVVAVPIALYVLEENVARGSGAVTFTDFLQALESALGTLFFVGAAVLFVATLEVRIKRRRALRVIHELRSMAHIVDMHQLTKDPERIAAPPGGGGTPSSPPRTLDSFQLGRYLDYCTEALSLIAKVAAIYVQRFSDPVLLEAVDDVEDLCTGLSRKIWQKIMLLDQIAARGAY